MKIKFGAYSSDDEEPSKVVVESSDSEDSASSKLKRGHTHIHMENESNSHEDDESCQDLNKTILINKTKKVIKNQLDLRMKNIFQGSLNSEIKNEKNS